MNDQFSPQPCAILNKVCLDLLTRFSFPSVPFHWTTPNPDLPQDMHSWTRRMMEEATPCRRKRHEPHSANGRPRIRGQRARNYFRLCPSRLAEEVSPVRPSNGSLARCAFLHIGRRCPHDRDWSCLCRARCRSSTNLAAQPFLAPHCTHYCHRVHVCGGDRHRGIVDARAARPYLGCNVAQSHFLCALPRGHRGLRALFAPLRPSAMVAAPALTRWNPATGAATHSGGNHG